MPRQRKTLNYNNIVEPLSVQELILLKSEIDMELKNRKREEMRKIKEQNNIKIRDKIKIGQTIAFKQISGKQVAGGKAETTAEVTAIFKEKVQVLINGRKRSISLGKITST